MTPAERARLIDKQEFEAECRAVRKRVYARLGIKRVEDRAHMQRAMSKQAQPGQFKRPIAARPAEPKPKPTHMRRHGPISRHHTIAGRTLTRRQWAAELGITSNAMDQAVYRHGSVEAVVIRRFGGRDQ
ncbi:hypothetical protein FJ959_07340 [Mesorhizobium sp. B2-2-4]|uniref:hypothetical protein n=1 Tax=unclassified Mesorhizobium TaxID=325217 RepID=UPI0011296AB1|nr:MULTISPECIES: hypothetical protein [unclassified Mesorhizobium]TPM61099.1 hypothetical protein FJ959_07340 [Mesorhizobium sp. B2-2-4]TPM70531.1 hypothetical protein FJ965_01810 [Mesorhizobium sp. B2-2-1]TPN70383.1 hypothetical protein FJ984_07790 [Mesorhizobium sp. B1-1-3]